MNGWLTRKTITITSAAVCVLLAAGAAYLVTKNYYEGLLAQVHPQFVVGTKYELLRPIIGISVPGDQFNNGFPDVRGEIQSLIKAQPAHTVERYAFYLRDLSTGNWTGINEDEPFDPASLLKVVVALAAYRQGEERPSFLSTSLTYTPQLAAINNQLEFALPSKLMVGQSYPVPFLVKKELADSDNGAVYTLLNSINDATLNEIYQELDIPPPGATSSVGYKLNAREYSRFFRILYNGTLNIDWAHAQQILEDMTQSTFTAGLAAGVPSTVKVAHKYGEHVDGSNGVAESVELSDCGIVYYPSKPYFLCVMVQGKNQDDAAGVIAKISKLVYKKMSSGN